MESFTSLNLDKVTVELPGISGFEKGIVDLIISRQGLVRNCGRNAIRRMSEAWKIRPTTPELAVFAAITAQEEASSAVIVALQNKQYPGAEKLDRQRHIHKVAIHRGIEAIQPILAIPMNAGFEFLAQIDLEDQSFPLKLAIRLPDGSYAYPVPPLEGIISRNDQVYDFFDHFKSFASERNASDLRAYIERRVNERNRTLYASDDGIPIAERNPDEILPISQQNVFKLLAISLFIDLYERQSFVQRALDSIRTMLKDKKRDSSRLRDAIKKGGVETKNGVANS